MNESVSGATGSMLDVNKVRADFPILQRTVHGKPLERIERGRPPDDQGNRMQGLVVAIEGETVTMDFNHPLAEKTLMFQGKILKIREATPEEIAHGHVHGEGGVHH